MREHDVFSADGTRIRVWRTDNDGPDVLLSPGLGAVHAPDLPDALCWIAPPSASRGRPPGGRPPRVLGWYHRGTRGSARPDDPARITVDDHVADAIAALDDAGVERCVVTGWSLGVTIAAELALRHPERVSGLMLVAGAAGDPFASVLGVPGVPEDLRRLVGVSSATALRLAGPLLDAVLHRVPVPDLPSPLVGTLRRLLKHDWRWYFTLALALGRTPRLDLTGVTCPTTVLAGRYDWLASPDSLLGPVAGLPQARVRVLPNTHFLPLENPALVAAELALLLERVAGVEDAVQDLLTSRSRPRA